MKILERIGKLVMPDGDETGTWRKRLILVGIILGVAALNLVWIAAVVFVIVKTVQWIL